MRVFVLLAALMVATSGSVGAAEVMKDGKLIHVPVCGGKAGLECNPDEWCDYPASAVCGIGDHFGTCKPRPEICTEEHKPVCGCDGEPYGNACKAEAGGTDVNYEGPCT